MNDYIELDFLDVETKKSGDAIPIRYSINGAKAIHVVDGGFQATGKKLVEHIQAYYGAPAFIDRVVLTHNDGDHAGGLGKVFEEFEVGELWMLRPWLYADELLPRFARFTTVEGLRKRLREAYPNIEALEKVAEDKGVPIFEPFQGAAIGEFTVLSPSKATYLDMVVASEKTPQEAAKLAEERTLAAYFMEKAAAAVAFVRSLWGVESFSDDRFNAMEPIKQGLRKHYGSVSKGIAAGLAVRSDHGSQYVSDYFQRELRHFGVRQSLAYVGEPQTNGVIERFWKTLKKQVIEGRIYQTLADLRKALANFMDLYNRAWRLEKLGGRTPDEARQAWVTGQAA